ncbi:MAG: hypothetical protein ABI295_02340 [Xanthomarina sp.]
MAFKKRFNSFRSSARGYGRRASSYGRRSYSGARRGYRSASKPGIRVMGTKIPYLTIALAGVAAYFLTPFKTTVDSFIQKLKK